MLCRLAPPFLSPSCTGGGSRCLIDTFSLCFTQSRTSTAEPSKIRSNIFPHFPRFLIFRLVISNIYPTYSKHFPTFPMFFSTFWGLRWRLPGRFSEHSTVRLLGGELRLRPPRWRRGLWGDLRGTWALGPWGYPKWMVKIMGTSIDKWRCPKLSIYRWDFPL